MTTNRDANNQAARALYACPFCGNDGRTDPRHTYLMDEGEHSLAVCCGQCGAVGPWVHAKEGNDAALAEWVKRASQEPVAWMRRGAMERGEATHNFSFLDRSHQSENWQPLYASPTSPHEAETPAAAVTDEDLRTMWRTAGGRFYGPNVETGAMPESALLPFLRGLALASHRAAPVEAPAAGLHPITAGLVERFAAALRDKLATAEKKYGYSDGWTDPEWEAECRKHLMQHIAKGDPRDVAAYCAFMWWHGWSTAPVEAETPSREALLFEAINIMDALMRKSDCTQDRNSEFAAVSAWKIKARGGRPLVEPLELLQSATPAETPSRVPAEPFNDPAVAKAWGRFEAELNREPTPFLQPQDLADLERLDDLFSDDEGWDLPKFRMQRLAKLGVIRRTSGSHYAITSFGLACLREPRFPLQTAEEFNEEQRQAMLARASLPAEPREGEMPRPAAEG